MKKTLLLCLFFFCLIGCVSCMGSENQKEEDRMGEIKENEKTTETIGQVAQETEPENIIVLTYGENILNGIGETICEAIGAVHYTIAQNHIGEIKEAVAKAEYILIGTNRNETELEFALKNCLVSSDLEEKKTALFLIDQMEKKELYEERFAGWYPEAQLLPSYTMESGNNLYDELGRMNGWLTTILTYDKIPE